MRNKNKIIFGCIFSIILLVTLPSTSAVEHNIVVETNKQRIIEKIEHIDIEELQKLNNDLKNLDVEKELNSINNGRSRIFLRLLLFLLVSFTSMIIKIIFKSIGAVFSAVVITILVLIITVITTIITIIGTIIGGIALIVLGFAGIIYKIGELLGIFESPTPEED